MFRKYCILIALIFFSLHVKAINAVVANTVFYLPDSAKEGKLLPYVETSWEIIPHTLHFRTTTNKTILAQVKADIVYSSENTIVAQEHFIFQTTPRATVNEIGSNKIIGLKRYFLPAGKIKIKLKFTDINDTTSVYVFTDSFKIDSQLTTPFYSKLQLLDSTSESQSQDVFTKNGIQQIPLNGSFLDDNQRTLIYYAELYNSKTIPAINYPLIQKVFIAKTESGSPYQFFTNIDTVQPQDIALVSGYYNIASLVSGNYYLNVTLENKKHIIIAASSMFFQRINKHPAKEDSIRKIVSIDTGLERINVLDLDKTFIGKFTVLQMRAILKMMLPIADPIATQSIRGFLDKPEEMYMRYFIYNFFANIDSKNPSNAWKEYSDKVLKVNKLFKAPGTAGYETERGFVYLRYGPPTEIIPVDNEPGALPYEIWQYNTLIQMNKKDIANALFLFYKPNQAIEDYILLHTNVGGESQNLNWRKQLYLNANSSNTGSYRAEQYFGTSR